jgi:hypothetical protein
MMKDVLNTSPIYGFVRKPYQFEEIYDSLGHQLGIEFSYQEVKTSESLPAPLSPEQLSVLPSELRKALKTATESLDRQQISQVLDQVADIDADLADRLMHLANRFDYPAILSAFDGGEA